MLRVLEWDWYLAHSPSHTSALQSGPCHHCTPWPSWRAPGSCSVAAFSPPYLALSPDHDTHENLSLPHYGGLEEREIFSGLWSTKQIECSSTDTTLYPCYSQKKPCVSHDLQVLIALLSQLSLLAVLVLFPDPHMCVPYRGSGNEIIAVQHTHWFSLRGET